MTEEDRGALYDLRSIWRGDYHISCMEGTWRAEGHGADLTAPTAEALHDAINDHYGRQVDAATS
jgi:hypothetical protein